MKKKIENLGLIIERLTVGIAWHSCCGETFCFVIQPSYVIRIYKEKKNDLRALRIVSRHRCQYKRTGDDTWKYCLEIEQKLVLCLQNGLAECEIILRCWTNIRILLYVVFRLSIVVKIIIENELSLYFSLIKILNWKKLN